MGLMDVLQHYANAAAPKPDLAHDHFDEVSAGAPREVLAQGMGDAFRADSTPPFGDMVGRLFGQSDPQQRAGVLNQLIRSIGPGVLASLGGGLLGRLASPGTGAPVQVTPEQASQLTPEEAQTIATRAEQQDPGIVDKIGGYYAQHPQLFKTLGSAALAVALAGVANRMRR